MVTNENDSGSQPHIESSDSEDNSTAELDFENSESDEDIEELDDTSKNVVYESSVFVSADGTKFWTPKCEDNEKPHTNEYFPTLEDAYQFYFQYGRKCGFDVRKSTEKTDSQGKIKAKYIQCNRAGGPYQSKSKKSVEKFIDETQSLRRTTSKRCNCKAQIILKPAGNRGFVIMSFIEEHNHPLASESDKMFLRCNRNVSIAQQHLIVDCGRANIGAVIAHSLNKEMVGSYEDVGATVSDFKNFARDIKVRIGKHDTDMILAKFKLKKETSNNTFFYDYKIDKEGHLTGLFWTDAIGQANFEVFGDIVSFDPTFRTNRYNMVFVPFTGVNNHWKNVTFAAGLLAKENYKNFKWLIRTFKNAMGRAPHCVITDQCPAIKKALKRHWKSTTHRLCMWHIMNKLPGKIGPALATNKKFMEKFKSVVYSDHLTRVEFDECWKAVITEYKLEGNEWLNDMFIMRDQWIPAYFSDIEMAGLLRTTSRSESSNSFFQHFHESGDTLIEFYSSFESAMDKQRLRSAEDDKRSEQTPQMSTPMKIEKDAYQLYTLEIYYLIREEIMSASFHTTIPDMTNDDVYRYFKCRDDLLHGKIFEVSVRMSDNHVACDCKLYFRRGYLCRHAFAALHQCSVHTIPRQFVKPRWTKNAVKHHSTLGSNLVPPEFEQAKRKKLKRTRAWFEFHNSMNYAGEDEEKLDLILTALDSISSKLSKKPELNAEAVTVHRADRFIGPPAESEPVIQNPNISRNKGCGSRIKSSREISLENGKGRKCSNCNKSGHNRRSCTLNNDANVE